MSKVDLEKILEESLSEIERKKDFLLKEITSLEKQIKEKKREFDDHMASEKIAFDDYQKNKNDELNTREKLVSKKEDDLKTFADEAKRIEGEWNKLNKEKEAVGIEKKALEKAKIDFMEKEKLADLKEKQLEEKIKELIKT